MRATLLATTFVALLLLASTAEAAEVCGDTADNDANGHADEGCFPTGVTGVCESPVSCALTGAIAPVPRAS